MEQKRFKAAGIAIFAVATGVLLFRISAYFIVSSWSVTGAKEDLFIDLIFSLPVQILVCLVAPLLIYKFYQRKTIAQVFIESNYKKVDIRIIGLSVLLGVGAIFASSAIGTIWLVILTMFGYNYSPSPMQFTESFNIAYFLASLFFTAVLPGFCEEFAMRGTFLNSVRSSARTEKTVIIIMAVSFGLFHQNIVQLVYTAFFGAAMAGIVLRTRSIYPAIVAHFTNNALVVLISYADNYGWFADPTYYFVKNYSIVGLALTLAIGAGIVFLSIWGILAMSNKENAKEPEKLYKPTIRECAFYIGAIVMTALSTIFTFAAGF